MAAFLNLVHLVTGIGDPNPVTSSPGRSFTKWVFVGDVPEEEDARKEGGVENKVPPSCTTAHDVNTCPSSEAAGIPLDREEKDNMNESINSQAASKRTKNQRRKDKKKNRNRSNSTLSSSSDTKSRGVSWGDVEEVLFHRDQGLGSVPSSGLHPLGFGPALEEDRVRVSIDVHVSSSQVRLIERARELGLVSAESGEGGYKQLETRQFDYKKGSGKNPLFHSSTEEERISLLGHNARSRSRSRSNSLGTDETIHTINDGNREIMDIRKSRESAGCSCKPVKADKLSVGKLRQELISHKDKADKTVEQINALSKSELVATVKDVLLSCPLCVSNSCCCVREGIGCHVEVCACFKKKSHMCQNEFNQEAYCSSVVDAHRSKYVTATASRRSSSIENNK